MLRRRGVFGSRWLLDVHMLAVVFWECLAGGAWGAAADRVARVAAQARDWSGSHCKFNEVHADLMPDASTRSSCFGSERLQPPSAWLSTHSTVHRI